MDEANISSRCRRNFDLIFNYTLKQDKLLPHVPVAQLDNFIGNEIALPQAAPQGVSLMDEANISSRCRRNFDLIFNYTLKQDKLLPHVPVAQLDNFIGSEIALPQAAP